MGLDIMKTEFDTDFHSIHCSVCMFNKGLGKHTHDHVGHNSAPTEVDEIKISLEVKSYIIKYFYCRRMKLMIL